MALKAPVRLTPMTRSQSSGAISAIIGRTVVPAPLTRLSMPPDASAISAATAVNLARSAASTLCAVALPPRPPMSAATVSTAAAARSRTATHAPAAANARQVAAPIPLPPPVTRTIFPTKSSAISISSPLLVLEQSL